jgi:hypothetical protein
MSLSSNDGATENFNDDDFDRAIERPSTMAVKARASSLRFIRGCELTKDSIFAASIV